MALEHLIKIINDITRKETVNDISNLAIKHILDYFDFDYCVISIINYIEDKIESKYIDSKKYYTKEQLEEWRILSCYNLNSPDILVKSINSKEIIYVKGSTIDGITYDLKDNKCPLNTVIYDKFNHKYLNRIFMAFIHRVETNNSIKNDKILGIIETGYYDPENKIEIDKNKIDSLKIYVDNLAQCLHNALSLENLKSIKSIFRKYNYVFEPDEYLNKLFKQFIKLSKASAGEFFEFDFGNQSSYSRKAKYDPQKKLDNTLKFSDFEKLNKENSSPSIIIQPNEIGKDKFKVLISFGLNYNESNIGILNLYYTNSNKFFKEKGDYLNQFVKIFSNNYQKKKINKSISEISLSFPLFIDIKEKLRNVINTLCHYFITDDIIIWQKHIEDSSDIPKFKALIANNKKHSDYIIKGLNHINPTKVKRNKEIAANNILSNIKLNKNLISFCKQNYFKSHICIPIIYQNIDFGFIDIFLKQQFGEINTEDEIFISQIINKLSVSIQLSNLTNYYSDILNSLLREDLNEVLKKITNKARVILNANPIILFLCEKDHEVKFTDAYDSGSFFEETVKNVLYKKQDKEVDLARIIIKHGTRWIENENEYIKLKEEVNRKWDNHLFSEEFWYREKIKSFAAIKLEYRDETLGVIFINYRKEQKFSNDFKDFINAFASLISVAIINAKSLTKIKEQREKLLNLAEMTNPGSIAIGYIHDAKHSMHYINALISSLIYLIPENQKKLPQSKSVIESLEFNTNHLASLFTSLINIAHEKEPIFQNENIKDILDELEASFETRLQNNKVNLKITLKNKEIVLKCDRNKILQVFINLFTNSLYALDEQKYVNKEIYIEISKENQNIIIIFNDNGIGISETNIIKVFKESFSTKKGGGSGFGLLVIKRIIDTHQGSISVKSEFGKSTTFKIILPQNF